MTFTAIIDVAIGLMFTYLLLGFIASALQETVASWLQWRGNSLRAGIQGLLDAGGSPLFQTVITHALIHPPSLKRLPSYIHAQNFSMALTDALKNGSNAPLFSQVENSVAALPNSAAKQALESLIVQSGGDYAALKSQIENWFDNAMDRVSGIYKRRAHTFAISFGILVAVLFNVDSVDIARALWRDPQTRGEVVATAQKYVDQARTVTDAAAPNPTTSGAAQPIAANAGAAQDAVKQLDALPIPIGWPSLQNAAEKKNNSWFGRTFVRVIFAPDFTGLWKLIGWAATALAVSLGAPFWFDMLSKFLNIRSAGPVPVKAPA